MLACILMTMVGLKLFDHSNATNQHYILPSFKQSFFNIQTNWQHYRLECLYRARNALKKHTRKCLRTSSWMLN